LKRFYCKHIEERCRIGFSHIDKDDFLEAFLKARTEAYKPTTIRNGFAAAGLIPLDPERVLEKLNVVLKTPTPTPPGSSHSNLLSSCFQTPSNLHELQRHSTTVKKRLDPLFSSPSNPTLVKLNQVYKSCELAWHNATLLAQENMELRSAIEKEDRKHRRSKRPIRTTASLTAAEVQNLLEESNAANQLARDLDGLPRQRAPHTCSNCHIIGHNRRNCPNTVISS
jgi:hypothetical protein